MSGAITLTLDQIRVIFGAGMSRGNSEAVAFEWGSTASGTADGDLADALHEIANEGIGFDDPRYIPYGKLPEIWAMLSARSSDGVVKIEGV